MMGIDRDEHKRTAYTILDVIHRCFDPAAELPRGIDFGGLFEVSKAMGVTALTAYGLKKAGLVIPSFDADLAKSQRRSVLYDAEYKKLSAALTEEHIWHCPVKGMVIKKLYPAVGLREMTDMDICFDPERADDVRRIMEESGYSTLMFGKSNHDVYEKSPIYCAEMHRHPIDAGVLPDCVGYYDDFRQKLIGEGYALVQSREDEYIYNVIHTYKHHVMAGVGARALLDIYVMLDRWGDSLDMEYIERECQTLGIQDFESMMRRLAENIFSRGKLDNDETELMDVFICSKVHGSLDQFYLNSIKKTADDSGKLAYIRSRLKMPDNELESHPILKRNKGLRPLYNSVRFVKALVRRPKSLTKELRILSRYKKNQ